MRHLTKDDIMGDKPFFHATIDSSLDIADSLYSNYLVPFQAKTSKSKIFACCKKILTPNRISKS
jgi:hypothetical protein